MLIVYTLLKLCLSEPLDITDTTEHTTLYVTSTPPFQDGIWCSRALEATSLSPATCSSGVKPLNIGGGGGGYNLMNMGCYYDIQSLVIIRKNMIFHISSGILLYYKRKKYQYKNISEKCSWLSWGQIKYH